MCVEKIIDVLGCNCTNANEKRDMYHIHIPFLKFIFSS